MQSPFWWHKCTSWMLSTHLERKSPIARRFLLKAKRKANVTPLREPSPKQTASGSQDIVSADQLPDAGSKSHELNHESWVQLPATDRIEKKVWCSAQQFPSWTWFSKGFWSRVLSTRFWPSPRWTPLWLLNSNGGTNLWALYLFLSGACPTCLINFWYCIDFALCHNSVLWKSFVRLC